MARAEIILLTSVTHAINNLRDISSKISKNTIITGNLKNSIKEWSQVTNDQIILSAVTLLIQNAPPPEYHAFSKEVKAILNETRNLLGEKDIDQEKNTDGNCICNIFTRDNKNGKFRTILNLTELNKHAS